MRNSFSTRSTCCSSPGPVFGAVGAGFYVALRGLRIGPGRFQLLSMSLGPAVVIGALLVNTEGVDFRLLEPLWLAIALFVWVPPTYVVVLSVVAERVLARGSEPHPVVVAIGLMAWVPLFPGVLALAVGWAALLTTAGTRLRMAPAAAWTARTLLTVVCLIAVADLVSDYRTLS